MPENAQTEITDYLSLYEELQAKSIEVTHLDFSLQAKGIAMQQAGVIPMDTSNDTIHWLVSAQILEGLR